MPGRDDGSRGEIPLHTVQLNTRPHSSTRISKTGRVVFEPSALATFMCDVNFQQH